MKRQTQLVALLVAHNFFQHPPICRIRLAELETSL